MSDWHDAAKVKPPLHNQVLVKLREGVGTVCDVAAYLGQITADGETAEKWVLADQRLDARQIARWAYIYPQLPKSERKAAESMVRDLHYAAGPEASPSEVDAIRDRARAFLEQGA